jgi:hypothetical protein
LGRRHVRSDSTVNTLISQVVGVLVMLVANALL